MSKYTPFDGNQSIKIGDLTIENSEDKIVFYGDLEITRDKKGLEEIEKLLEVLNEAKNQLKKEKLPDNIEVKKSTIVNNPFKK